MNTFIRTSSHSTRFANTKKKSVYDEFLLEYREAVQQTIDHVWQNGITYKNRTFHPTANKWDLPPSMISTTNIQYQTRLSARAIKCASTQAMGMIHAVVNKFCKKYYALSMNNLSVAELIASSPTKPIISVKNFKAELNSICCKYDETSTEFDGFLVISSIGRSFGKINIPIKMHSRANYWKRKGNLMASFLLSTNDIDFRWKTESQPNKNTSVLGADAGQTTLLSLSNGHTTDKLTDKHGWNLSSINQKMSKKKRGSKAYHKSEQHMTNFVNWSIKQLNLSELKELRFESNKGIKTGTSRSGLLNAWSWTKIHNAIVMNCEEWNVSVSLQSSPYKSQRCNNCGYVHQKNRKSKKFECLKCHHTDDADINSAKNNELDLIPVFGNEVLGRNRGKQAGFYWFENRIEFLPNQELVREI